jgi:hypothetical protein
MFEDAGGEPSVPVIPARVHYEHNGVSEMVLVAFLASGDNSCDGLRSSRAGAF